MNAAIRNIIIGASLAIAANTYAVELIPAELQPMQAHTIALEDYTAVVYYTVLDNGDFQVVTSAGPNPGVQGEAMQHIETVKPGTSMIYKLVTTADTPATEIQFNALKQSLIVAGR